MWDDVPAVRGGLLARQYKANRAPWGAPETIESPASESGPVPAVGVRAGDILEMEPPSVKREVEGLQQFSLPPRE